MNFSQKILNWFHIYGRKNLPWKKNNNIYNIWVSEIMLQRTQVKTVIPYFIKFKKFFPNIKKLAKTSIEKVLFIWSGLGFYQRAHNLHKTAKIIQFNYKGIFPTNIYEINKLPGIGRSTAGAILSFSKNFCYPILDINVKRILMRYYYYEKNKKNTFSENKLWYLINQITPIHHTSQFNQGIMDLGALVCKKKDPTCILCPLQNQCYYHNNNILYNYIPKLKKKNNKKIKIIGIHFLIIRYKNLIFLEKIKKQKIWKNLFYFPIFYFSITPKIWKEIKSKINTKKKIKKISPFIHYFSHIKLYITSYILLIKKKNKKSSKRKIWYNIYSPKKIGVPAPISKIIKYIKKMDNKKEMKKIKNRIIFCSFLKKNTIGLDYQFYPGEIGQKIYNEISQIAWSKWIKKQTKIINEKKLNMFSENDRKIIENKMIKFLFQ